MDKRSLVESDFKDGATLVAELDKASFNVYAALWLYDIDRENWRLIIASDKYDDEGPKKAYMDINRVLDHIMMDNVDFGITLDNITAVSINHVLINHLSKAIHTGPDRIEGIRFSQKAVNNHYIEDAYIYRIA